jgi:hypothetical protein
MHPGPLLPAARRPPQLQLLLLLLLLLLLAAPRPGLCGPSGGAFERDQLELGLLWSSMLTGVTPCGPLSNGTEDCVAPTDPNFFVAPRPQHVLDATGMSIPGFDCTKRVEKLTPTPLELGFGLYPGYYLSPSPSPTPGAVPPAPAPFPRTPCVLLVGQNAIAGAVADNSGGGGGGGGGGGDDGGGSNTTLALPPAETPYAPLLLFLPERFMAMSDNHSFTLARDPLLYNATSGRIPAAPSPRRRSRRPS